MKITAPFSPLIVNLPSTSATVLFMTPFTEYIIGALVITCPSASLRTIEIIWLSPIEISLNSDAIGRTTGISSTLKLEALWTGACVSSPQ